MRERPWLEPRVWSSANCSYTVTSARSASAHAVAQPITPAPTTATRVTAESLPDDRDAQEAEPAALDLERLPGAEGRERAAGLGDEVAGKQARVARGALEQRLEPNLRHLVRRQRQRAEREREVVPLRALELRRDPLDQQRVRADAAVEPDDRRPPDDRDDLVHAAGEPHGPARTVDRGRVREGEVAVVREQAHRGRVQHRRA